MFSPIKTKLVLATLIIGVSSSHVSAMSMMQAPNSATQTELPIVSVHMLHNSCMYGSVTPSGTGNPKSWHRTAEAGVHTSCTPTPKPGGNGKLTFKPNRNKTKSLQLSN